MNITCHAGTLTFYLKQATLLLLHGKLFADTVTDDRLSVPHPRHSYAGCW